MQGFRRVPRPGLNDEALLDLGMATDPRLDRRQQSPVEQTCQPAFAQVCSRCARSYFNRGLGLHFIVYTVLSVDYFHPGSRSKDGIRRACSKGTLNGRIRRFHQLVPLVGIFFP